MNEQTQVYELENPNGIYIGITCRLKRRMYEHKYSPNIKLKEAIERDGWDSFNYKVIYTGTEEECLALEYELVDTNNPRSYNIADGGGKPPTLLGEKHWNANMTDEEAKTIIERVVSGKETRKEVAKDTGHSYVIICMMVRGDIWKHIDTPRLSPQSLSGPNSSSSLLSEEDVLVIRQRGYDTLDTFDDIAEDYPITNGAIGNVIRGFTHKDIGGLIRGKDYQRDQNNCGKVLEETVIEIRTLGFMTIDSYPDIGLKYNLGRTNIGEIITGKTYSRFGGPILGKTYQKRGEGDLSSKAQKLPGSPLSELDIIDIRERAYRTKDTFVLIAKDYPGVTPLVVARIVKGERRADCEGIILGKDYKKRGEGADV